MTDTDTIPAVGGTQPRPGSPVAVQRGCTCPVLDNSHGAGRCGDGAKYGWWQDSTCPLHGAALLLALQTVLRNSDSECAAVMRVYHAAEGDKP